MNALAGGMDLSADFTTDKDGFTRTDDGGGFGWSIGAYERDLSGRDESVSMQLMAQQGYQLRACGQTGLCRRYSPAYTAYNRMSSIRTPWNCTLFLKGGPNA